MNHTYFRLTAVIIFFFTSLTCKCEIKDPDMKTENLKPVLNLDKKSIPSYDSIHFDNNYSNLNKKNKDYYYFKNKAHNFKIESRQKFSTFTEKSYFGFIMPSAMIAYGVIAHNSESLRNLDYNTNHEVKEHFPGRFRVDDFTQYVPTVAVFGLDFLGLKAKNSLLDRTLITATSYLLMTASVQTIKHTSNIERPDGSNFRSFPSGHTATAFVGAHILFKEYKHISPMIGFIGYAVAGGTGVMRVINKKHWVSDVVAGAGMGMLCVELSYLMLPVYRNIFDHKSRHKTLVFTPSVNKDFYGIGGSYTY